MCERKHTNMLIILPAMLTLLVAQSKCSSLLNINSQVHLIGSFSNLFEGGFTGNSHLG